MPVEIEAKMKLDSAAVDAVINRLRQGKATFIGEYLEQNSFFDTEDRALLAVDEGLRVRTSQDIATGASRTIVTHKGPAALGQLKTREETEVELTSATGIEELLARLGYLRQLTFQKRRQSWRLDNCKIELDVVPLLGHFIEIEGPSEDQIMQVRASLGLGELPLIRASYIAMLTGYLQERGDRTTSIIFTDTPAVPSVAQAG